MTIASRGTRMRNAVLAAITLVLVTGASWATQEYSASGMVLKVDPSHKSFVVSCQAIPGFMNAMTMPFEVRTPNDLDGLAPGAMVELTLVVEAETSYAKEIKVRSY